jgi:hypothetical protein
VSLGAFPNGLNFGLEGNMKKTVLILLILIYFIPKVVVFADTVTPVKIVATETVKPPSYVGQSKAYYIENPAIAGKTKTMLIQPRVIKPSPGNIAKSVPPGMGEVVAYLVASLALATPQGERVYTKGMTEIDKLDQSAGSFVDNTLIPTFGSSLDTWWESYKTGSQMFLDGSIASSINTWINGYFQTSADGITTNPVNMTGNLTVGWSPSLSTVQSSYSGYVITSYIGFFDKGLGNSDVNLRYRFVYLGYMRGDSPKLRDFLFFEGNNTALYTNSLCCSVSTSQFNSMKNTAYGGYHVNENPYVSDSFAKAVDSSGVMVPTHDDTGNVPAIVEIDNTKYWEVPTTDTNGETNTQLQPIENPTVGKVSEKTMIDDKGYEVSPDGTVSPAPIVDPTTVEYPVEPPAPPANYPDDSVPLEDSKCGKPLDMSKMKHLGSVISSSFPFSIPWDIYNAFDSLFGGMSDNGKPDWVFKFSQVGEEFHFSIPDYFDKWMPFIRGIALVSWNIGLIYALRKWFGGAS